MNFKIYLYYLFLLIHFIIHFKYLLFLILHRGKATDSSAKNMFIHLGSIIVEKKGNLEKAIEDAINIGADDVEELKEDNIEYFEVSNKLIFLNI